MTKKSVPNLKKILFFLAGVTNGTLANIIRQLSSLSRHAEEMFGNLFKEAEAVASRSSNIQARIDRLAIRVTQLDSTVEEGIYTVHSTDLSKLIYTFHFLCEIRFGHFQEVKTAILVIFEALNFDF